MQTGQLFQSLIIYKLNEYGMQSEKNGGATKTCTCTAMTDCIPGTSTADNKRERDFIILSRPDVSDWLSEWMHPSTTCACLRICWLTLFCSTIKCELINNFSFWINDPATVQQIRLCRYMMDDETTQEWIHSCLWIITSYIKLQTVCILIALI